MYKCNISIIGAGKVGCSIAIGLKKKGVGLKGIYTRTLSSLDYINDKLGTTFKNDLAKTIKLADVIFLTVADSEIEYVTKQIISISEKCPIKGKYFFHFSGALDSDRLNLLRWQGAYTGSMHPIQTFADKREGWRGLDNIYYGFEGQSVAQNIANEFIKLFNSKIILIRKDTKSIYHIAACFISNYIVSLVYISENLFNMAGIESETGLKAFEPLIRKTMENIFARGTIDSMTGPIARGDINTIVEHLAALHKSEPKFIELYNALGKITTEIALEKKTIDRYNYENLNKIFNGFAET